MRHSPPLLRPSPPPRLPEEGFDEVAASATGGAAWPPFAGTFPLSGRAAPAPGGVVLTGRWGFASGIVDAAWAVGGCTTESGPRWAVIPIEQVTVHDTWQVSGLEETQSHDYSVDDVFVPHSRLFDLSQPPPRGGVLHRLPIYALISPDHCGVSLGIARRALDEITTAAAGKNRLTSVAPLDERPAFQRDLGQADTKLRAARALVLEVLDEIWNAGVAQKSVEDETDPASPSGGHPCRRRLPSKWRQWPTAAAAGSVPLLGPPLEPVLPGRPRRHPARPRNRRDVRVGRRQPARGSAPTKNWWGRARLAGRLIWAHELAPPSATAPANATTMIIDEAGEERLRHPRLS